MFKFPQLSPECLLWLAFKPGPSGGLRVTLGCFQLFTPEWCPQLTLIVPHPGPQRRPGYGGQSGPVFSSGVSPDHSRGNGVLALMPHPSCLARGTPMMPPTASIDTSQPNLADVGLARTESQPNWDQVPRGCQLWIHADIGDHVCQPTGNQGSEDRCAHSLQQVGTVCLAPGGSMVCACWPSEPQHPSC